MASNLPPALGANLSDYPNQHEVDMNNTRGDKAINAEISINLGSALRPEWCGSFTLESLSASILVSQSLMKSTKK
jgi:hypothetical protein